MVAALPLIRTDCPTMFGSPLKSRCQISLTEDRDLFGARLVVFGREIATDDRRDADDLEEIFRHISAGVALRIVVDRKR